MTPGECSSPEARTASPQSQPSDVINFASDPNKATTDVTETIKEAHTGSNEGSDSLVPNNQSSSEETESKNGSSTTELSVATNSVQETSTEVTNRSGSSTTEEAKLPLIVDLRALQNIRFKRDDGDESLDSSNSNDPAQDEAEQREVENSQSDGGFVYSSSKEIGNVEEDPEDSTNEESPVILEESGYGAELRGERNTNTKEILEGTEQRQGSMIHSWYNPSLQDRPGQRIQEVQHHNFIRVPVFTGK